MLGKSKINLKKKYFFKDDLRENFPMNVFYFFFVLPNAQISAPAPPEVAHPPSGVPSAGPGLTVVVWRRRQLWHPGLLKKSLKGTGQGEVVGRLLVLP